MKFNSIEQVREIAQYASNVNENEMHHVFNGVSEVYCTEEFEAWIEAAKMANVDNKEATIVFPMDEKKIVIKPFDAVEHFLFDGCNIDIETVERNRHYYQTKHLSQKGITFCVLLSPIKYPAPQYHAIPVTQSIRHYIKTYDEYIRFMPMKFAIDLGELFEGYFDPTDRWNGWAQPYFEYPEITKVMDNMKITGWEVEYTLGDHLIRYKEKDNPDAEWEECPQEIIKVAGQTKYVWRLGNGWIWDSIAEGREMESFLRIRKEEREREEREKQSIS